MNDVPQYPWQEGDHLFASALNAAIANGPYLPRSGVANVVDFGADPTGVADSTSAIRAALAFMPTKDVYMPHGNYRISDSLTVGAGGVSQRLYGGGHGSVIMVDTTFSPTALGVIILAGTTTPYVTQASVEHLAIRFAIPTDMTATLSSFTGSTLTLAALPAGVVVGDLVTDNTDSAGIQTNYNTRNAVPPGPGTTVTALPGGNQVTLSLPPVAGHIAAGHEIRFAHPRSMFRALGSGASTAVGGYAATYPWAIYADTTGAIVINDIMIAGAWNGIWCHPGTASFRVTSCYTGALNVGLDIDADYDGGFVENMWYSPYGIYVPAGTNNAFGSIYYDGNTKAFSIGRADGLLMANVGAFCAKMEIKPSWTFGQLVNIDCDFPEATFTVGAHTGLLEITNFRGQAFICNGGCTLTNFLLAGYNVSNPFVDVNAGSLTLGDGSLFGGAGGVVVRNGGTLRMRDTVYNGPSTNWTGGLIQVQAGNGIDMQGCSFIVSASGPGLTLGSDSVYYSVLNNSWTTAAFTPPGQLGAYEPGLPAQQGGMAAAGTTQATATPINSYSSNFNSVPVAGNGCVLPAWAARGSRWTIYNNGANTMNVWPPVGFALGPPLNIPVSLPSGMHGIWVAWDGNLFFNEHIGPALAIQLTGGSIAGVVSATDLGLSQVGNITAVGTTQGTATPLTAPYSNVTTTPAGSGVILSATPPVGARWVIWNHGANSLNLYPAAAQAISPLGINAPLAVAANAKAALVYWGGLWFQED